MLLLRGSRDTEVALEDADRYAAVLTQARVTNRIETIDGADHDFGPATARERMLGVLTDWMRESLG